MADITVKLGIIVTLKTSYVRANCACLVCVSKSIAVGTASGRKHTEHVNLLHLNRSANWTSSSTESKQTPYW
jgi:hypothetical protein